MKLLDERNDGFYVYILANRSNTVLHIGVTDDLSRHYLTAANAPAEKLVYFERYSQIRLAAARQKTLRALPWKKKVGLVRSSNRDWVDLKQRA